MRHSTKSTGWPELVAIVICIAFCVTVFHPGRADISERRVDTTEIPLKPETEQTIPYLPSGDTPEVSKFPLYEPAQLVEQVHPLDPNAGIWPRAVSVALAVGLSFGFAMWWFEQPGR